MIAKVPESIKMATKKSAAPKLRTEQAFSRSPKTPRTPTKEPVAKTNKPIAAEVSQGDTTVYLCQICATEDDLQKIRCDECMQWYHFICVHLPREVMQQDCWLCGTCKAKKVPTEIPAGNLVNVGKEKTPKNPTPAKVGADKKSVAEKNKTSNSDTSSASQRTIQAHVSNLNIVQSLIPSTQSTVQPPNVPIANEKSNAKANSRKATSVTSSMSRRTALALQRLEEERQLAESRDKEARRLQSERDKEFLRQKYVILEDDAASNLSFDDQEVDARKFESVRRWIDTTSPLLHSTNVNENEIPVSVSTSSQAEDTIHDIGAVGGSDNDVTAINLGPAKLLNDPIKSLPNWLINPTKKPETLEHPLAHLLPPSYRDAKTDSQFKRNVTLSTSQGDTRYLKNDIYDFSQPPVRTTLPNHGSLSMSSYQPKVGAQTIFSSHPQTLDSTSTTFSQSLIADQTILNGPAGRIGHALGANQQNSIGVSHSTLIGPNPQIETNRSAPINQQSTGTTTTTVVSVSQMQPVAAIQTQPFSGMPAISQGSSASQHQFLSYSQSHLLGATQPQIITTLLRQTSRMQHDKSYIHPKLPLKVIFQ